MMRSGYIVIKMIIGFAILAMFFVGFSAIIFNNNEEHATITGSATASTKKAQDFFFNNAFSEYYSKNTVSGNKASLYQENTPLFPANARILKGTNKDMQGSDTVTVRYKGNAENNVFNCQGSPLTAWQSSDVEFFINSKADLACAAAKQGVPDLDKAVSLIENVELMRIRYGEDTNMDGHVDRYVPADAPDLSLDRVKVVKIIILLRSTEPTNPLFDSGYYTVDGIGFGPFNDHYLRKVLTITLPVNNVSPKQQATVKQGGSND
jgi:hypothetical protein